MNRTRSFVATLALLITTGAPQLSLGPDSRIALAWGPSVVCAQVGVDPAHSPYRDILHGNGWTVTTGRIGGDGGSLRQSPNGGIAFGLRYDVRFSQLLGGFVGLSRYSTTRQYLAHDDSVATRYHGALDQPVWLPEAGLQVNLSGAKTWHGFAPFLAVSMGVATSGKVKSDTSGFVFGTKLAFTPSAGARWYLSERIHVRLEGQLIYWKMKYPTNWLDEPTAQPGPSGGPTTAPVPNVTALADWVHTPAFRVGVGFSF